MSLIRKLRKLAEELVIGAIADPRPMAVQLDITNACNLSCTHCYHPHHSNRGAISLSDWMGILKQVQTFTKKFRCDPFFILCGGEPLVSPFLKPIVEGISEMFPGMRLVILTNGTVHRIETLRFLANHNVAYQVSLDGPDASRHDCVRGEGSFDKSLKGIKTLQGFGAEVSILSILSSRTKPWIAEFFALAKALEVDSQNFTRLIAQGNGKMLVDKQADRPLSGPELKEALESILINSVVSGVATNTNQPLYALIDERVGQSGYFGFDALVIDYKGNLKATSRADLIIGNVLERTIEDLFLNNPILRKVRSGIIDVCGKCELYDRCGGDRNAAYAEFGDFTARDPGCWK